MRKTVRFTPEEDGFIKANIGRLTCTDIAKHLGRNPASIVSRCTTLGLRQANRTVRKFSKKDDKFIKNNAGKISLQEISRLLERSTGSVWGRGKKLEAWFNKKIRNPEGRKVQSSGYIKIRLASGEWRHEHVVVVEEIIGRHLRPGESVHHINCDKSDNRPENLYLCRSNAKHNRIHTALNRLVSELLASGAIYFDSVEGDYQLCEKNK